MGTINQTETGRSVVCELIQALKAVYQHSTTGEGQNEYEEGHKSNPRADLRADKAAVWARLPWTEPEHFAKTISDRLNSPYRCCKLRPQSL